MIDGVKIKCVGTDYRIWKNHSDLSYNRWFKEDTGETPPQSIFAELHGLKFFRFESKKDLGLVSCQIRGSLHKFWNDGNGNADSFSFSDIRQAIKNLKNDFGVFPEKAILENCEFGLNIQLPFPASEFLKNIVSMPQKRFETLDIKTPKLGKICCNTDYDIKIYDKLLQQKKEKNANILRIEIKGKNNRYLNKFGVRYLSDLTNVDNLTKMGHYLLEVFKEVIYYDFSIDENILTVAKQLKLARFYATNWWERLDPQNRIRQKRQYEKMMLEHGGNDGKKFVENELAIVWKKLNIDPRKKAPILQDKKNVVAEKMYMISNIIYMMKSYNKDIHRSKIHNEKSTPNCEGNTPTKLVKKCLSCGRDISHQKARSKYCSTKYFGPYARRCRDAGFIKMRRERRKAKRDLEETNLAVVLLAVGRSDFEVVIFWKDGFSITTTAAAFPSLPRPHRSVVRVAVSMDAAVFELTTRRAKSLVKELAAARDG